MNKCDSLQEARDDFKKECDSLDIRSGSPLSGTQQPSISPEPPYNIKPVLYIFFINHINFVSMVLSTFMKSLMCHHIFTIFLENSLKYFKNF